VVAALFRVGERLPIGVMMRRGCGAPAAVSNSVGRNGRVGV
jgi:hypothetical protein